MYIFHVMMTCFNVLVFDCTLFHLYLNFCFWEIFHLTKNFKHMGVGWEFKCLELCTNSLLPWN